MSTVPALAEAIRGEGHWTVDVFVEGRPLVVAFTPDLDEHRRRTELGAEFVTDRRLLHALWELPAGIRWPTSTVDAHDLATLEHDHGAFATLNDRYVERHYEPAGRVEAVATVRRRLGDSVAAVAAFPPIFRRYAAATHRSHADGDAIAEAASVGVGTFLADGTAGCAAADPLVGVPGVYRWWFAEIAYRAWLPNAH